MRGFVCHEYHSSLRAQRAGSAAVEPSRGVSTSTTAGWMSGGWPDDHAPSIRPYQAQSRSESAAEWTPT